MLLFITIILSLSTSQDDFIGDRYCAFDNITSMNYESSSSNNFKLIVSPSLEKYSGNPLFGQDRPWEARIDNGYPNVIYSPNLNDKSKTYQLWYDCFLAKDGYEGTLYAKSNDGINWDKAVLNINEWNGNTNNNIMFLNSAGIGIFKDKYGTNNESELYKAFGQLPGMPTSGGIGTGGIASSANGINNWSKFQTLFINKTTYQKWDTHNNMFYDLKRKKYIGITRIVNPRMVGRTEQISINDNQPFINDKFSNAQMVETGGDDNQTYVQITFPYYNVYLGLVMIYDTTEEGNGRVYCQLSWSPDSIKWYRINGNVEELIPLSAISPVEFDSYICFTAAYPIIDEGEKDKIRLYYFGGNGPHDGQRNSSFALAKIRMDGFAGATNDDEDESALIETYSLMVDGIYLFVNIDVVGDDCYAKIGLKDVEGFSLNDSIMINKNVTDSIVSWKSGNSLNELFGKNVIIQFELYNAVLYTFGFTNSSTI